MSQSVRPDDRSSVPESKFYTPAGIPESSVASRVSRLWASLFNHGVDTST
jgi:hypothetical protein